MTDALRDAQELGAFSDIFSVHFSLSLLFVRVLSNTCLVVAPAVRASVSRRQPVTQCSGRQLGPARKTSRFFSLSLSLSFSSFLLFFFLLVPSRFY